MDFFLSPGDVSRIRDLFAANPALVAISFENGISCPGWILAEMGDDAAAAWLNEAYGRVAS